jgi:hypothetical protein
VFAAGLVLAAHLIVLSGGVLLASVARVSVQSAFFWVLLYVPHVVSAFATDSLLCCSFSIVQRSRALRSTLQDYRSGGGFHVARLNTPLRGYCAGNAMVRQIKSWLTVANPYVFTIRRHARPGFR